MLCESERAIRNLFENARRDQELYGVNSTLHIIIFEVVSNLKVEFKCSSIQVFIYSNGFALIPQLFLWVLRIIK
jgi:hypothetical protein